MLLPSFQLVSAARFNILLTHELPFRRVTLRYDCLPDFKNGQNKFPAAEGETAPTSNQQSAGPPGGRKERVVSGKECP